MDVFEAIKSRRSCRSFSHKPVEIEKLDQILEAGQWAPSPANSQPWEFVVVSNDQTRVNMLSAFDRAGLAGKVELHGYSYVRPAPGAPGDDLRAKKAAEVYSVSFLNNVPVMIAVAGDPDASIRQRMDDKENNGYKYACAASVQNMLLAAQALGLGSLWLTFFESGPVKNILNIKMNKHLIAVVCIGYSDIVPASPGRLPLQAIVRRIV